MRSIALVLLFFCAVSCTSRGYAGPARSSGEVSTVTLNRVGELSIERIVFDGRDNSPLADNIELLPGKHDFQLYYSFEEKDGSCYEDDPFCYPIVTRGICEGSISTLAGRTYLVTVENRYSLIEAGVAAKGYFDFSERTDEQNIGGVSCR